MPFTVVVSSSEEAFFIRTGPDRLIHVPLTGGLGKRLAIAQCTCAVCFTGEVNTNPSQKTTRTARRGNRMCWFSRHLVTGELRRTLASDCENGLLALHLAGGRDVLADYEMETTKPRRTPPKL